LLRDLPYGNWTEGVRAVVMCFARLPDLVRCDGLIGHSEWSASHHQVCVTIRAKCKMTGQFGGVFARSLCVAVIYFQLLRANRLFRKFVEMCRRYQDVMTVTVGDRSSGSRAPAALAHQPRVGLEACASPSTLSPRTRFTFTAKHLSPPA
jgi:hypothetical protein